MAVLVREGRVLALAFADGDFIAHAAECLTPGSPYAAMRLASEPGTEAQIGDILINTAGGDFVIENRCEWPHQGYVFGEGSRAGFQRSVHTSTVRVELEFVDGVDEATRARYEAMFTAAPYGLGLLYREDKRYFYEAVKEYTFTSPDAAGVHRLFESSECQDRTRRVAFPKFDEQRLAKGGLQIREVQVFTAMRLHEQQLPERLAAPVRGVI